MAAIVSQLRRIHSMNHINGNTLDGLFQHVWWIQKYHLNNDLQETFRYQKHSLEETKTHVMHLSHSNLSISIQNKFVAIHKQYTYMNGLEFIK